MSVEEPTWTRRVDLPELSVALAVCSSPGPFSGSSEGMYVKRPAWP